jgi:hypothetical protein
MATKKDQVRASDLSGWKYFGQILPLFAPLREVGCERDRAGNRQLHMDQYCTLVLLFLFNPCLRSLRALQQACELKKVQRKLGCARASLGSLSEATDVFDPERLREIVGELAQQVQPLRNLADQRIYQTLMAVDGSVVKTLSTIAQAAFMKNRLGESHSAWRLHTHFDIDRHVPVHMDVTVGANSGEADEKSVLRKNLQGDHCYVMDRWFAEFTLFNDIHEIGGSYVCRIRDNSKLDVVEEERVLSDKARQAGVLRDAVICLGHKASKRPNHKTRVVFVKTTPHVKRGGRKGQSAGPSSDVSRN